MHGRPQEYKDEGWSVCHLWVSNAISFNSYHQKKEVLMTQSFDDLIHAPVFVAQLPLCQSTQKCTIILLPRCYLFAGLYKHLMVGIMTCMKKNDFMPRLSYKWGVYA